MNLIRILGKVVELEINVFYGKFNIAKFLILIDVRNVNLVIKLA